jgi:signal peptidase
MRVIARATTLVRRVVDLGLLALIIVVLLAVVLSKGAPLVGRQSIVIGGSSMEPTIPLGSAIVVEPIDPSRLAVGEVVSMQVGPDHATYTHRIIAVVDRPDGRWIRTQGDANRDPDPTLVPASAVIGRVEWSIPAVGYVLVLLSLPVGVIFVLGVAATLLAVAWLLESLEPVPAVVATQSHDPVTGGARPPDLVVARGEPIAARPTEPIAPDIPTLPALSAAFAGSSVLIRRADASVARPTVRQQLQRSREVRERRARWERSRGKRSGSD